jgi:hypothetical protein
MLRPIAERRLKRDAHVTEKFRRSKLVVRSIDDTKYPEVDRKLLRQRAFLGPDAYVFGEATTGAYVASLKSAWETLLLLANGIKPTRAGGDKRVSNRMALAQIDLHWHDLRHEALSRLADECPRSRAAVARRARQHHDDAALHERACEFAGRVDAPGTRTARQSRQGR